MRSQPFLVLFAFELNPPFSFPEAKAERSVVSLGSVVRRKWDKLVLSLVGVRKEESRIIRGPEILSREGTIG